jgi:hypothetical protein
MVVGEIVEEEEKTRSPLARLEKNFDLIGEDEVYTRVRLCRARVGFFFFFMAIRRSEKRESVGHPMSLRRLSLDRAS